MNLHKLIKPLSIGIISLGLLAGIGIVSNNTNIHAMTADQLLHDPYVDAKVQKDNEEMEAYGAKQAKEGAKAAAEQDREDTFPDDTPSQQPMPVDGNYNVKPTRKHAHHHKNVIHHYRTHSNKRARYTRRTRQNKRKRNNKRTKLTKKQYRSFSKKIRNAKRALKSRRAKHSKRYSKSLKRQIRKLQKQLKA